MRKTSGNFYSDFLERNVEIISRNFPTISQVIPLCLIAMAAYSVLLVWVSTVLLALITSYSQLKMKIGKSIEKLLSYACTFFRGN